MWVNKMDYEQLYLQAVSEIFESDVPKYDSLIRFVEKHAKPYLKSWCSTVVAFKGGRHEEDILQEILIIVVKKSEKYFFFAKGTSYKEKSCDDFKAWLSRVSKNYFLSYKDKYDKGINKPIDNYDDDSPDKTQEKTLIDPKASASDRIEKRLESEYLISKSFELVFDLKNSPHIILTWLAVSLLLVTEDLERHEAIKLAHQKFDDATLYDMFCFIERSIEELGWLKVDARLLEKQKSRLEVINEENGFLIGESRYSDFYMNKGALYSMSDWVNRIDSQIVSRWQEDA